MYCGFYNLSERPFALTPNPDFIYLSKNHREAFAHLLYGIDHHAGFIQLTGEVGTGKTTVIRTLLSQLDPENYRIALIFNPCLSAASLMQTIGREFGISGEDLAGAGFHEALNHYLLEQNAAGRTVVLVIDEAQNLEPDVLEQIRLISNLETKNDKLIQIVLVGQSELENLLQKPELRQLNQRITVRYRLQPMGEEDTREYIRHRLRVAGAKEYPQFTDGAFRKIYRFSGGLPRLVNAVCDRALTAGYVKESKIISPAMAATAVNDIANPERVGISIGRAVFAALAVIAIVAATVIFSIHLTEPDPSKQEAAQPATAAAGPAITNAAPAIQQEIFGATEEESVTAAMNGLLKLWGAGPLSLPVSPSAGLNVERLAELRGLRIGLFTGSLGALIRLDMPALLMLSRPGAEGRRYLALTGVENDRFLVSPAVAGRGWLTGKEMESLWSGRAYFIWRDYLDIPIRLKPGSRGKGVEGLQKLLSKAGDYGGPLKGIYDKATVHAVEAFQTAHGMKTEAGLGRRTLILLYRDAGIFPVPRLSKKEDGKRG